MSKISVVVNTLNEEKNLPGLFRSLHGFADEIVVVDMESEDKTKQIARSYGAKVYNHKRVGFVEPARNFAIEKASGDWILILDADERLSPYLAKKLKRIIKNPKADYYRIPRQNLIFGSWVKHSRWWPDYLIRFFKKGTVVWSEIIHSVPTTIGEGLDLLAKEKNAIVHYHYDSIDQFIERMNRYTSRQAEGLNRSGYIFQWQDLIEKPTAEFLSRYFSGEGYKDGVHGLALANLQGVSELVLYLKVWQIQKFEKKDIKLNLLIKEMRQRDKNQAYWYADSMLKIGGGLKERLKRKFKIL
ncbi:hypothetical protein A2382_00490 [Candidatus Woesebacteria bacterium RIFOXYB1_FULL_38_16]|uniref:Glycosyltransferase 2-like domain-containing protein n=1 Tax=Candidatus Woesebacteria bacterium RIFOXYB1_FULL_38_16 TaxID=1802538 RepID=A0A1F8CU28_9BACT|nr:MAG: hypothetical protein A2191_01370 [Candidatus Woesebacteria bacterium RIFOXYA1_FULL_38_9]OGM79248.1 MAG: hypothetical protein A2382_00490 [Candidatus Woesebacteria bacterium RIFOXYB1_FULL_38_16]